MSCDHPTIIIYSSQRVYELSTQKNRSPSWILGSAVVPRAFASQDADAHEHLRGGTGQLAGLSWKLSQFSMIFHSYS